ncbi:hypothetical protein Poli38472_013004 [Pythium oligandrum]|uniref:Cell growth-regulating nucleolar protein n=1 Tax=Pythium oligandrum TaxID=41045 RepID=A0A8K1FM11_PYTOL|nr:hypothetical protein Poli38472_013004 [Pythium oligandrum]|eukprot:TMW64382.1 hypothetical protein Poli38472_013004 [Pythium oligandrum]
MVFFVCEGCNETLKKNKVDAHAARCRNCWAVSCVDCSVVFEGNDYAAHTSCISEAQKYEGSLYKAKSKKMSPQERWMDVVQNATAGNDKKLQSVLSRVAGYDNVPRKKAKFVNFMKNSIGGGDMAIIEKVWNVFEDAYKASEAEANATNDKPATTTTDNGDNKKRSKPEESNDKPEKESKKAKTSEDSQKDIKWAKLIKLQLKSSASKELELKTLRDQVIQHIVDNKLSSKDAKELKKEFKDALRSHDKFSLVEVVRLTE